MRWLLFIAFSSLTACAPEGQAPFAVLGFGHGSAPLTRDQSLVLRFSEALDPRWAPAGLLVRDADGHQIRVRIEVQGAHLLVHPEAPTRAWPAGDAIEVHILHPSPGLPLQSASRRELSRGFRARVPLAPVDPNTPVQIVAHDLDIDPKTGEHIVAPQSDARPLTFRFDAPIDDRGIAAGVQLVNTTRRSRVEVDFRRDPRDWTQVLLPRHHRGQELFLAGERYEIRVTRHLKAIDGRPAAAGQRIPFRVGDAEKGRPRTLVIEFARPGDLDAQSEALPQLERGTWQPESITRAALPRFDPGSEFVLDAASGLSQPVFGTDPARIQVLIPAAVLGEAPGLLRGLALRTAQEIPAGTEIRDLEISLGVLPSGREGLSGRLEDNLPLGRGLRRVPLPGQVRSWVIPASDLARDASSPALLLPFGGPVPFDGESLVLQIRHGGIRLPPDIASRVGGEEFARRGIELIGIAPRSPRGAPLPAGFVLARESESEGQPLSFLPAFALEIERFPTLVSRWYIAQGVEDPEWFLEGREWVAEGLTPEDIELHFQGGEPITDPRGQVLEDELGRPLCRPLEDAFGPIPPARGVRAVRVRVRIDPRLAQVDPKTSPPELAYVFLRYRERKDALQSAPGR